MQVIGPGSVVAQRYKIIDPLGRGGMGVVYHAHDVVLEEPVALKVLRSDFGDGSIRERFRAEIKLARRVSHRNVCRIHEYGQDGDLRFISMELITGTDLRRILRDRGGLDASEAFAVSVQALSGLQAIHQAGIIHRDLKSANIMRDNEGIVRLMDFGIAKEWGLRMPESLTVEGQIIGTPEYMSPEQARAEKIDFRSDIYSMGIVIFEVFTGHVPFHAATPLHTLFMQMNDPPPVDSDRLPLELRPILVRALAKVPGERFADVRQMLDELRAAELAYNSRVRARPALSSSHQTVLTPAASHGDFESGPDTGYTSSVRDVHSSGPSGQPAESSGHHDSHTNAARQRVSTPVPSTPGRKPGAKPRKALRRTVGRFLLHEKLADGHSGPLYKAYDPVRGCLVGLKLITTQDPEVQQRLLRGGNLWLTLKHPHLVSVFEVHPRYGGYSGVIESELVDGITLRDLIGRPRLNLETIISIGSQLCDALDYVHSRGIVHREVKPSNVVVSLPKVRVTLLDSGIARHANPEIDAFTRTGIVVGDLAYSPPEMTRGTVDQRVDIYAAAVILVELLSGRSIGLHDDLGQRAGALEGIAPRLKAALVKALDRSPEARFQSAQEFADVLRSIVPQMREPREVSSIVVTLHGIRTHATWQRAFSEVAAGAGLEARMDRWSFGHFSILRFLQPWSRTARVKWFRTTYDGEFEGVLASSRSLERPSIVAHSFGTYILGYALLRYPYLRFGKVILCGSILPRSFPWNQVIDRGQVQAVRNEFGTGDIWTRVVDWFVPGTGPSGVTGFDVEHARLEQERFGFSHSEYFERFHMASRWVPFLRRRLPLIPEQEGVIDVPRTIRLPWGLYVLYAFLAGWFVFGGRSAWDWVASR